MGKYKVLNSPDVSKSEMVWAFGFTAADGSLVKPNRHKDPNFISYHINQKDEDVLYKIKDIFGLEHPVHRHLNNQGRKTSYMSFTDSRYENYVFNTDNLGIKFKFPTYFLEYNTRHYLRGLVDGDGCIHHRKRGGIMLVFINEYEWIVKDFSYCVSKHLGLGFKVPKKVEKDHIWRIQYEAREARMVIWWLYHGDISHMSLGRKRDEYLKLVFEHDNPANQLFCAIFGRDGLRYRPVNVNGGLYIPLSCAPNTDTLKLCQAISRMFYMCNIIVQPIFKNKGYYKYYVPYFPREYVSSIKMLRPFLEG